MTNDERSPNTEARIPEETPSSLGLRASSFPRHSSFVIRHSLLLALLWLIATAFNVTKAVHIDDTAYLEIALAIRDDPLHAMSAPINWVHEREPIHSVNQPHLFFYLLAGSLALFGESEVAFHLLESVFTLGSLIFFYLLARRFAPEHALYLCALFVLGPAFLPAQNVMCDVPMLTFWLIVLWAVLTPDRGVWHLVLAALAASAACLIKYTSLVLLPVLALDLFWRREWLRVWVLAIPVVVVAAWSGFNYLDYGGIHLFGRTRTETGPFISGKRLVASLICLGAVAPFTVLLLPGLLRRRGGQRLLMFAVFVGAVMLSQSAVVWRDSTPDSLLRSAFLANGALLLAWGLSASLGRLGVRGLLRPTENQRPDAVMAAWLLGLMAFLVLVAPFMAVRHILPLVPVLLLLMGRVGALNPTRPAAATTPQREDRIWRAAALGLTVLLGAWLAVSDWMLADVYRRAAPRLMAELEARESSQVTIWFAGHWGWQWYARKAGMRQYNHTDSPLPEGDYLVLSELVPRQDIPEEEWRRLRRVGSSVAGGDWRTLLRTMAKPLYGGYYGIGMRSLPWSHSTLPLDEFVVFRVGPPSNDPPPPRRSDDTPR
jgi:4-amino-4-deoxy-L-arabinose transferase-like glycosyltransferase